MKVVLVVDRDILKNMYTLLGKDWCMFYSDDYNKLRTYFREVFFQNLELKSEDKK